MDEARLTVGELARRTGLTVRTLHHWDELGLLTPAERSGAGYRLYGQTEVERVYRISAGTDPADLRAQDLVARADALIEAFTGGDDGIRYSLGRMYREQGPERASRGMVKPELAEYLKWARAARRA